MPFSSAISKSHYSSCQYFPWPFIFLWHIFPMPFSQLQYSLVPAFLLSSILDNFLPFLRYYWIRVTAVTHFCRRLCRVDHRMPSFLDLASRNGKGFEPWQHARHCQRSMTPTTEPPPLPITRVSSLFFLHITFLSRTPHLTNVRTTSFTPFSSPELLVYERNEGRG